MGTLYSVATPIGNLEDITLRALTILKTVNLILAEDTRTTQNLLRHFCITTPLLSYHQHSSSYKATTIIDRLRAGETIALVSDAGTPAISDPGSLLIQQVIAAGIQVVPIPGPSAVITALQAAGVDTSSFLYLGFLPHKKGRQTLLQLAATETRTVVMYESPHRLLKALDSLRTCSRQIVVARELTKIHEEFVRGDAETVYQVFQQRGTVKGECVIIIHN